MAPPSILTFLYYADIENNSGNRTIVEERLNMTGATASRAHPLLVRLQGSKADKGKDMLKDILQDPSATDGPTEVQYNRRGQRIDG